MTSITPTILSTLLVFRLFFVFWFFFGGIYLKKYIKMFYFHLVFYLKLNFRFMSVLVIQLCVWFIAIALLEILLDFSFSGIAFITLVTMLGLVLTILLFVFAYWLEHFIGISTVVLRFVHSFTHFVFCLIIFALDGLFFEALPQVFDVVCAAGERGLGSSNNDSFDVSTEATTPNFFSMDCVKASSLPDISKYFSQLGIYQYKFESVLPIRSTVSDSFIPLSSESSPPLGYSIRTQPLYVPKIVAYNNLLNSDSLGFHNIVNEVVANTFNLPIPAIEPTVQY